MTATTTARASGAARAPRRRRTPPPVLARRAGAYAAGAAVLVFSVFPVYWMVATAFKPVGEIFSKDVRLFPGSLTLEHFDRVINGELIPGVNFWEFLGNSLLVTLGSVAAGALLSLLAAVAVARFRFKMRTAFIMVLMVIQMVPCEALIISIFINFRRLQDASGVQMLGNLTGILIVYTAFSLPITIMMLRGFVAAVPRELEEAAAIDGAGPWTVFWRILMPLVAPGLVAASIFAFITAWNEFIVALTFLGRSTEEYTLPLTLSYYFGRFGTEWGAIMAASTLLTLPVMAFFLFVQRRMVSGLTMGAVKG
ncbi:carbohydrate ABC transporter permease [Streptomonospora nanhaiensis]|uniref:N,N'-diacetylchitobiose transport system permease protein n=1 Tax=Streptomonospora nanhaiensis TaxID=1323731 RepID=A0A853BJN7_9ACTN|nr:carbohydrate ABC transporter permease [Streptomonospora nanhaiensis]MBV2363112.1 carbohydrate ABC transporter permease [Streptomonospora nanhaiensis]MBX9390386.1 carbohydrate ABC transporter permease [Streptomonospora nanhaiensis]NYI95483.1 N,N'-diacetylchitobiose transport system permease protein [Streptomonospora nanhaiensis]